MHDVTVRPGLALCLEGLEPGDGTPATGRGERFDTGCVLGKKLIEALFEFTGFAVRPPEFSYHLDGKLVDLPMVDGRSSDVHFSVWPETVNLVS